MIYTGVRVGELNEIKLEDVNLNKCQIKVVQGKGNKDRIVPFPNDFREVLAAYIKTCKENKNTYLSLIGKRDIPIVELEKYYYTIQSYQV